MILRGHRRHAKRHPTRVGVRTVSFHLPPVPPRVIGTDFGAGDDAPPPAKRQKLLNTAEGSSVTPSARTPGSKCNSCQRDKRDCNKQHPTCDQCSKLGLECTWKKPQVCENPTCGNTAQSLRKTADGRMICLKCFQKTDEGKKVCPSCCQTAVQFRKMADGTSVCSKCFRNTDEGKKVCQNATCGKTLYLILDRSRDRREPS